MLGLGLSSLWAASAYAVYGHWAWPGLCVYAVGSHLLRSHLPRVWGYEPMKAGDAYLLLAPFPDPVYTVVAAVVSKTTTAHIKADLQSRVFPNKRRARQFPIYILGKAYWAEDPHFNLDDHLITVKQPITSLEELGAFAGSVAIKSLPSNKPQWCAYIVEDFQGDSAFFVSFLHAYQDGNSWVNTLTHNSDPQCVRAFFGLKKPGSWERRLTTPLAVLMWPYELLLRTLLVRDRNPLTVAPHSGDKTLAYTTPLPLSVHQARAKALGVTFNDYLIAAVLRAVSAYIAQQHGSQHHKFTLGIPISLRGQPSDGSPLPPGNDITYLMLPMPPVTSPTLEKDISQVTKKATAFPAFLQSSSVSERILTLMPPALALWFFRKLGDNATVMVSNLPGPKAALSYSGVQIKQLFATPIAGIPLIATIVSYRDQFTFSFTSDVAVIKDLNIVARLVVDELTKT